MEWHSSGQMPAKLSIMTPERERVFPRLAALESVVQRLLDPR